MRVLTAAALALYTAQGEKKNQKENNIFFYDRYISFTFLIRPKHCLFFERKC
jgi:hypothetical protein